MSKDDLELQATLPPLYETPQDFSGDEQETLLSGADLPRASRESGDASCAIATAGTPAAAAGGGVEVYSSAGLLSVGYADDSFKCLVHNQHSLEGIKREFEDQLNHSLPDHEIVNFYVRHREGDVSVGRYLTPVSWSKIYPNLSTIGVKTRRTKSARRARTRLALLITFFSVIAGVVAIVALGSWILALTAAGPPATISRNIDFPQGLDAGAYGFIQCKNNQPSIFFGKGAPPVV